MSYPIGSQFFAIDSVFLYIVVIDLLIFLKRVRRKISIHDAVVHDGQVALEMIYVQLGT